MQLIIKRALPIGLLVHTVKGSFIFPGPFYDPFSDFDPPTSPPVSTPQPESQSSPTPVSSSTMPAIYSTPQPESQPTPLPVSSSMVPEVSTSEMPVVGQHSPSSSPSFATLPSCEEGVSCPAGTECIEALDNTCINLTCIQSFDAFGDAFPGTVLLEDIVATLRSIATQTVAHLNIQLANATLEQLADTIESVVDPTDLEFLNDPLFDDISADIRKAGNEFVSCLGVGSHRRLQQQPDLPFIWYSGGQLEVDVGFQGLLALYQAFDFDSGVENKETFFRICGGGSLGGAGSVNIVAGVVVEEKLASLESPPALRLVDFNFVSVADFGFTFITRPNILLESEIGIGAGASVFGGSRCIVRRLPL